MKRYRTTYQILDDFGEVVRVVLDKPTEYEYNVVKEVVFDTDDFEEALF